MFYIFVSFFFACSIRHLLLGGYSVGVPPLPIPNRAVKPDSADGTAMQCGRVGSRLFFTGPGYSNEIGADCVEIDKNADGAVPVQRDKRNSFGAGVPVQFDKRSSFGASVGVRRDKRNSFGVGVPVQRYRFYRFLRLGTRQRGGCNSPAIGFFQGDGHVIATA